MKDTNEFGFEVEGPVESGEFVFEEIHEGEGRSLTFFPPLRVVWDTYVDHHPAGDTTTAYIEMDFGMEYKIKPVATKNGGWHYDEINKDSTNEEVIKTIIKFDLFHAFCHTSLDPNYGIIHWALYGNLKDRVIIKDD